MISKISNRIRKRGYFILGWFHIAKIKNIKAIAKDGFNYSGYQPSNEKGMQFIYSTLNNTELTGSRLRLFNLLGKKVMIVATDAAGSNREIGMNMYYINPRDLKENTIHEGFIGVLPEHEGKGVASQMRKMAIEHFMQAGFNGISTRISKNNLGSLRSAEKLGFRPVEEYFDHTTQEDRYYLILKFKL